MLEYLDPRVIEKNSIKIGAGLREYTRLMLTLHRRNVSLDAGFQKSFRWFYRMNMARLSPQFYQIFFEYMETKKRDNKVSFEEILRHLYEASPDDGFQSSFASKLLASINCQRQ